MDKNHFKKFIALIGSGEETSKGMSRKESADAMEQILKEQASPAQIGAFMIAHRIRRPEPQELAGMLDTYLKLGPKINSKKGKNRPICFGMPLDGRCRTAPIFPLTTLILISEGQPVVLHGGKRMPPKYGVSTAELFKALGLDLEHLSLSQVQNGFNKNDFALINQPDHFQLADNLIIYRDEIGKRPPLSSMELLWTAHRGNHLLVSGYVHFPTEERAWETLKIRGERHLLSIKGLEGSTDFPISRQCQAGERHTEKGYKKIILKPNDYSYNGKDIPLNNLDEWKEQAIQAINAKGILTKSIEWNAGIYLWLSGVTPDLKDGLKKAKLCIKSGKAKETLKKLIAWRNSEITKL